MFDPEKIITENKERDAQILTKYWQDKLSQDDIGKEFNISGSRVGQILWANRSLVKYDPEFEKSKRIRHYEKQYEISQPENKTQEYWLDRIRDEVQVDKPAEEEKPSWLQGRLNGVN